MFKFPAVLGIILLIHAQLYAFELSVRAVGQGSVAGTGNYSNGQSVQLEAIPEPGHEFIGWSGELAGNENPILLQVSSDIQAIAHFRPILEDFVYIDGQPALAGSYVAKLSETGRRSLKRRVNRVGSGRVRRSNLALDDLVSIEMISKIKLSDSINADNLSAESLDLISSSKSALKPLGVKKQMKNLMDSGNFEFVEPNWVVSAQSPREAIYFKEGRTWALQNMGQVVKNTSGISGIDIGAEIAWETARNEGKNVIVAVIDSGVDTNHRELKSNLWRNPGEIPNNGIDDDSNGYIDDVFGINAVKNGADLTDRLNHGTPIAGIIGSSYPLNPSSLSIPGLAPKCKIMVLKALDYPGVGSIKSVIECIDYAIANGAHIINASYGRYSRSNRADRLEKEAIERAAQQGVLFVAAAGNSQNQSTKNFESKLQNTDGEFRFLPAGYDLDNIISVAAVDNQGNLARDQSWASSYGQLSVDLAAPGQHVKSITAFETGVSSFSGTSFAAPFVSGAAALLLGEEPSLSPQQLRSRLMNSSKPLDSLKSKTVSGGMLDLTYAMDGANSLQGDHIKPLRLEVSYSPKPPRVGQDLFIQAKLAYENKPVNGRFNNVYALLPNKSTVTLSDNGVAANGDEIANDSIFSGIVNIADRTSIMLKVFATVDFYDNDMVELPIELVSPPPNDDFANAIPLLPSPQNLTEGDNTYGSTETDEPLFEEKIDNTLWYSWVPSQNGTAKIRVNSINNWDTTLAVYTGTTLANLVKVATNDDKNEDKGNDSNSVSSAVEFEAIINNRYYIQVGGKYGEFGKFQIKHAPPTRGIIPNPPPVTVLPPTILTEAKDYFRVEGESIEFVVDVNGTPPFEYQWLLNSVPIDGAVFSSYSISRLSLEDSGDYAVQVNNKEDRDIATLASLEVSESKLAPANDNIENAEILFGSQGQEFSVTRNATGQEGEPDHAGKSLPHHSVWWKWVAPRAGTLVLDTEGSSFDTVLAAYRLKTSTATGSDHRSRRSGTIPGQEELPNNLTLSPATSQTPARLIWPGHGLQSGDRVRIDGLLGGPTTSAEFTIHVESPDQLELLGTLGAGGFNLGPSASFHKIPKR